MTSEGQADRRGRSAAEWAVLALAAGGTGGVLHALGVPAAFLVGPLVVSAVLGTRGMGIRVPTWAMLVAQAVSGCLIGRFMDPSVFSGILAIWPIVLFFALFVIVMSCFLGLAVARVTGLPSQAAVWGFMPGLAAVMIAMSAARGIDSRLVAVMQCTRVILVVLSMVALGAVIGGDGGAGLAGASGALLPNLPALLAIGAGFAIGRILPRFSFGPTFAALFVAGGCVWAGVDIVLPFWIIALAFASIGAHVGLRVTPDLARTALRSLPAVVGGAALQILMCALLAVVIVWLTGVDAMSAMLSTVPGSIETIGYLAVVTDAAVPFVMTLQTVRLIGLTTIGPILAETLSRRFAPDTPSPCGSR
jgi:hypothetical protein